MSTTQPIRLPSGNTPPPPGDQDLHQDIDQVLLQAEKEAEALIKQAREQAAQILNEAEEKRGLMEQNAYQQGLQKGEAQGKKALEKVTSHFHAVLLEAQREKAQFLKGIEPDVIHLILKMVKKILHVEPILNEAVLGQVVHHALLELGKKVDVHIYVHPEDVELLHFSLSHIQDLALEIVIEPDPSIAPGGCKIKSVAGNIEAQIDQQFDALAARFIEMAKNEAG